MRAISRGLRNVFWSKARAALVVMLLGLSVGVFITMAQAADRISGTAARLQTTVETLIEVRAAGATAMGRGVEPLRGEVAGRIRDVAGVRSVEQYLYFRRVDNSQTPSVSVIAGVEPITGVLRVNSHGEVGTPTLVQGRRFGPSDVGKNVAIVGAVYAQQQGLSIGSNLTVDGTSLEVIGIFDAGFVFGNNQVFVPLRIVQEAAFQDADPATGSRYIPDRDRVSQIFITAASVDRVPEVEREIRDILGAEADVLSGQQNAAIAADALDRVRSGSLLGVALSLGISALLVLFTMALVTRERTREIGILKALGAPNATVIRQFVAEAVAMSLGGAMLGVLVFAAGGSFIADRLLGLSSTSLTGLAGGMGSQSAANIVTFSLSGTHLGYAVALALVLGILGSIYPAYQAAHMRPADALRYE